MNVSMDLCLRNNNGQIAVVGSQIRLQLAVQSWVNPNNAYTITELRPDGNVVLDGNICQHISGIVNFVLV